MRKIIINIICIFIPSKDLRHKLRDKIQNGYTSYSFPYKIRGKNNKIIIVKNGVERKLKFMERIPGLNIKINGNNNLIKLELPIISKNSTIEISNDNANVEIGTTNRFYNVRISIALGDSQVLKIGKNIIVWEAYFALLDSNAMVYIGDNCLFSNSISIYPQDGHSILDKDTDEIINEPKKPLIIGNHVWIGEGVKITKNARIYDNSIVGIGSVACKDYKEGNVIIAGNPGKIVKQNISWDIKNTYLLKKEREKNHD